MTCAAQNSGNHSVTTDCGQISMSPTFQASMESNSKPRSDTNEREHSQKHRENKGASSHGFRADVVRPPTRHNRTHFAFPRWLEKTNLIPVFPNPPPTTHPSQIHAHKYMCHPPCLDHDTEDASLNLYCPDSSRCHLSPAFSTL